MAIDLWIVIILAAVDLMIVVPLYLTVRPSPPPDRNALIATATGLSGFVALAFLFFEGAILIIQLTATAAIIGVYWLRYLEGQGKQAGLGDELF